MNIPSAFWKPALLFAAFICIAAFTSTEKDKEKKVFIPQNSIKVADNLYADRTEVTNLLWLEYQNWVKEVTPKDSKESYAGHMDEDILIDSSLCLNVKATEYIYDLSYADRPVLGITQEQARAFNQWRTNSITHFYLIRMGHFKEDYNPEKHKDFTVEGYFAGEYDFYLAKEKIDFYYHYKLPNQEERKKIVEYAKQAANKYFDSSKKKKVKECNDVYPQWNFNVQPCEVNQKGFVPTQQGNSQCISDDSETLLHVFGNVSEWLEEDHLTAGGSWKSEEVTASDLIEKEEKATAWTGFRSVLVLEKVN